MDAHSHVTFVQYSVGWIKLMFKTCYKPCKDHKPETSKVFSFFSSSATRCPKILTMVTTTKRKIQITWLRLSFNFISVPGNPCRIVYRIFCQATTLYAPWQDVAIKITVKIKRIWSMTENWAGALFGFWLYVTCHSKCWETCPNHLRVL